MRHPKLSATFLASVTWLMLLSMIAFAQSDTPRLEIGGHFTALRLGRFDTTDPGVGGRVTFNLNDNLALEGEYNFLPRVKGIPSIFENGGRKSQGLFGVKYGYRTDRWGIFGKFRPGFVNFDKRLNLCPPNAACVAALTFSKRTEFAMDTGGVLEYYPARPVVLRFDMGNTIIRFTERGFPNSYESNLQFSTGIGFRF
jgi:hypothetical protein